MSVTVGDFTTFSVKRGSPQGDPLARQFLAMARHRLGHTKEARRWLDQAARHIDQITQARPEDLPSESRPDWRTRLYHRVLRREAEELIRGPESARPAAIGGDPSDRGFPADPFAPRRPGRGR